MGWPWQAGHSGQTLVGRPLCASPSGSPVDGVPVDIAGQMQCSQARAVQSTR
jgi:hypothetical protein